MTTDTHEEIVKMSLGPLFDQATEQGLWFYHNSNEEGEVWCSPPFLKDRQAQGVYIMAPEKWELRDPLIYMKQLHINLEQLVTEYNEMARRLRMEQTLTLNSISSNPAQLQ